MQIEKPTMLSSYVIWTFTGLRYLYLRGLDELDLGEGFSLLKPNDALLSARDRRFMSEEQYGDAARCGSYLVFKGNETSSQSDQPRACVQELQNGLIAFQIIKPIQTQGFIFQCEQWKNQPSLTLKTVEHRSGMDSGQWARMREFDAELLSQVPLMISRVRSVMNDTNAERKNSIILLQFALEHMHPLIAGLLHVMGMEAIFDSGDRNDFKKKLCDCLGASARAFPDWNSPTMPQPKYSVEELAIPLYMLRSKLAHGVDLRKASRDRKTPVDLIKKVELVPALDPRAHALLLSEAACYLHCQALQKVL